MASKAYKGKLCPYCSVPGSSSTPDHVVARKFFLPEHRDGLPIVPACGACNGAKSQLEHYLTAVIPFGGQHAGAGANLEMVEPRLAGNQRLARELAAGRRYRWISRDNGPWEMEMALPFAGERAEALYRLIAKGLAFHHWEVSLPDADCWTYAGYLVEEAAQRLDLMFAGDVRNRVGNNLGDGTFVYDGVQGVDDPRITMWRMSFGGAIVGGNQGQIDRAYAISAPRHMRVAGMLQDLLGAHGDRARRAPAGGAV